MAAKFENNKGFLIIEMTPEEAINKCVFGYIDKHQHIDLLVCDNCGDKITYHNKVYYVAVLNRLLCKDCCEYFVETSNIMKKINLTKLHITIIMLIK